MLREATGILASAGVPSPEHDARELAAHALGIRPADLVTRDTCTPAEAEAFDALVSRRAARVPLQHLTGESHFRRLTLAVGPGRVHPAPGDRGGGRGGAGGGTQTRGGGPSPARRRRPVHRVGSHGARRWPSRRRRLGSMPSSWHPTRSPGPSATSPPPTSICVWVMPPARSPTSMARSTSSWRTRRTSPRTGSSATRRSCEHDPALALWGGGPDGLDVPRSVIARAHSLLRPGGLLVIEHADVQGVAMVDLLTTAGWVEVADHRDLAGRDRYATARPGRMTA